MIFGKRLLGRKSRPKAESGVRFLGRGQQALSPPARGLWKRYELLQRGSGLSPDLPKGFPPFSALRMASVDCHAAIEVRQDPSDPLAYASDWLAKPHTYLLLSGVRKGTRPVQLHPKTSCLANQRLAGKYGRQNDMCVFVFLC